MLSRRQLRVKVLQALYAFFQSDNDRIDVGEKQLFISIDKIYELCFWQLSILIEVVEFAKIRTAEAKLKHFPTTEDLNPNTKFIENRFIQKLAKNKIFQKKCENLKINWNDEKELIRKIYLHVKESKEYAEYMSLETSSFIGDREFIIQIFKKQISKFDSLKNYYEDLSIYWTDDYHTATSLVIKIINVFTDDTDEYLLLPRIIKTSGDDVDEDRQFTKYLFRKTILKSKEYNQIITDRAVNWEFERIASMDILILKMALVELFEFYSIPVKVTMNEYIELAKYFSTPKSSTFVNGILDKLITEFTAEDRIKKSGRGLM
jgi:N utilization substance protein B